MTPEQRITALERENAKLKSKLQRVGLLPQSVDLPNAAELEKLLALVEEAHPALRPAPNETNHKQHFANAGYFLSFAYRRDEFSEYSLGVHADECATWLQRFEINGGTSARAFVAAAVASRFKYSSPHEFPFQINLGIGLGASARPVSAWRVTLREGRVPAPSEPKRPAPPVVQQLNLVHGLRGGGR